MSEITQNYKHKHIILHIISIGLTVLPLTVYTGIAIAQGDVHEKLVLGMTLTVSLIFVLMNILMKYSIRSTVWIMLLGIYVCLDNITPLLLIIAISSIIDEFIITPLDKKYKQQYIINKEIDKR